MYRIVGINGPHKSGAVGISHHRLLGNGDGTGLAGLLHPGPDKKTRQELSVWIGKQNAELNHARARVHGDIGKQDCSLGGKGVDFIVQNQHGLGIPVPGFHLTSQFHEFPAGLVHIHINLVEVLNGGKGRCLVGRNQGTFGDRGSADLPGDGGKHLCVIQIDFGRCHIGLGNGNPCLGLGKSGHGIIIFLLADPTHFNQFCIPFHLGCHGFKICPGLGEAGRGGIICGLIGGRINLV